MVRRLLDGHNQFDLASAHRLFRWFMEWKLERKVDSSEALSLWTIFIFEFSFFEPSQRGLGLNCVFSTLTTEALHTEYTFYQTPTFDEYSLRVNSSFRTDISAGQPVLKLSQSVSSDFMKKWLSRSDVFMMVLWNDYQTSCRVCSPSTRLRPEGTRDFVGHFVVAHDYDPESDLVSIWNPAESVCSANGGCRHPFSEVEIARKHECTDDDLLIFWRKTEFSDATREEIWSDLKKFVQED